MTIENPTFTPENIKTLEDIYKHLVYLEKHSECKENIEAYIEHRRKNPIYPFDLMKNSGDIEKYVDFRDENPNVSLEEINKYINYTKNARRENLKRRGISTETEILNIKYNF